MSSSNREYDELEETLGITFGIGIDCEIQYRLFCLYNAHGGQEGTGLETASVARTTFRRSYRRQPLLAGGRDPSVVKVGGQRRGLRGNRFRQL